MNGSMSVRKPVIKFGERTSFPKAYRCHLAIVREDDSSFSAIVVNLPGVGSCGDSEDEAVANAREAIIGALESYNEDGAKIPWVISTHESIPEGAKTKWILVDA